MRNKATGRLGMVMATVLTWLRHQRLRMREWLYWRRQAKRT